MTHFDLGTVKQLREKIVAVDQEIRMLQTRKRAACIKLAMLEAYTLGYSNNEDDYHNYIHQRIDELIGEYK
tara:strand:- start:1329 stop:1541 length:213 start_codon:yes stop_codon:yes gene_type:complete